MRNKRRLDGLRLAEWYFAWEVPFEKLPEINNIALDSGLVVREEDFPKRITAVLVF
jgi:hypothetical protein